MTDSTASGRKPASPLLGLVRALFSVLNPVANATALVDGLATLSRNFRLASQLAHRDMAARYKGQLVGAVWMVAHPLLQMLIFLFIFGVVFKQKIGGTFDLPRDYTTYILSGLMPWLAVIPALTGSCMSVLGSASLVKQFHFDTAALPLREVASTMYFWGVGLLIVVTYTLTIERSVPWTYALLPVLLALTFLMMVGVAWTLAAVTVFFRDIKDIIIALMNLFVYILPIVYLPSWTPEAFQTAIQFNPFSYMVWTYQDTLYFGRIEHPVAWIVFPVFAVFMFIVGHRAFRRLKPFFGNAL